MNSFGLFLCVVALAAVSAEEAQGATQGTTQQEARSTTQGATSKKHRLTPTEIMYGTWELVYDVHVEVFNFAYKHGDDLATKHGAYAKGQEFLDLLCANMQCGTKGDLLEKYEKVKKQAVVYQAQATEMIEKAKAPLNDYAEQAVHKFEAFAPSYKGVAPKNFVDLVLVSLYLFFVMWIVYIFFSFCVSLWLGMVCMIFCCCCRRRGGATKAAKKNAAKKTQAVEKGKAADGKAAAKANAGKKK